MQDGGRHKVVSVMSAEAVNTRALDIAERAACVAEALATPPARAYGRSLADFGELLPAEKKLVWACRQGEACDLTTDETRRVRAEAQVVMASPEFRELAIDVLMAHGNAGTGWAIGTDGLR